MTKTARNTVVRIGQYEVHDARLSLSWVGRWSMLDLFVIALMMSLVNRDQLLSFTMGPAAFYFGTAVILTLLAVEWLDSRLIWDAHATGNTDYTD